MRQSSSLLVLSFLLLGHSRPAAGELFVLAIGNDRGMGRDVPLRYAENDARRLAGVFEEMGDGARVTLLVGQGAGKVQESFRQLAREVSAARRRGRSAELVFYFSGHGDRDFLRLAETRLSWDKLRELVRLVGAELTVALIDACESGGVTEKRASLGPPFVSAWRDPVARGSVWLTSSRAAEGSYESDEIGGSFFSHFIISGLRGSADLDEDHRVTLQELYRYSYDNTVERTSLSLRRPQHPTYRFDIRGEGQVILTRIKTVGTSVVFPRDLEGSYFLARRFGHAPQVVEVRKTRGQLVRIGVRAGEYLVYRRDEHRIHLAPLSVREREEVVVDARRLVARRYREVVGKGGRIAVTSWSTVLGGRLDAPLVWSTPAAFGAGALSNLRGLWWGFLGELGVSAFGFNARDARVSNLELKGSVRAELFWTVSSLAFSVNAGLAGALLRQAVDGGPTFVSLSPGLVVGGAVEWSPHPPWFVRLDLAGFLWLRTLAERGTDVAPRPAAALGVGYRFR